MNTGTVEALERLAVTREALVAKTWATASEITGPEALDRLRDLARLRADVEAIDFAIANAPQAGPDEYATVLRNRGPK